MKKLCLISALLAAVQIKIKFIEIEYTINKVVKIFRKLLNLKVKENIKRSVPP